MDAWSRSNRVLRNALSRRLSHGPAAHARPWTRPSYPQSGTRSSYRILNPRVRKRARTASETTVPAHDAEAEVDRHRLSAPELDLVQNGPDPDLGGAGGRGNGDVLRYRAIFVERIATSIPITKGTAMCFASESRRSGALLRISRLPTNAAVAWGKGIPIL